MVREGMLGGCRSIGGRFFDVSTFVSDDLLYWRDELPPASQQRPSGVENLLLPHRRLGVTNVCADRRRGFCSVRSSLLRLSSPLAGHSKIIGTTRCGASVGRLLGRYAVSSAPLAPASGRVVSLPTSQPKQGKEYIRVRKVRLLSLPQKAVCFHRPLPVMRLHPYRFGGPLFDGLSVEHHPAIDRSNESLPPSGRDPFAGGRIRSCGGRCRSR